jgi:hypothetical protein
VRYTALYGTIRSIRARVAHDSAIYGTIAWLFLAKVRIPIEMQLWAIVVGRVDRALEIGQCVRKGRKIVSTLKQTVAVEVTAPRTVHVYVFTRDTQ